MLDEVGALGDDLNCVTEEILACEAAGERGEALFAANLKEFAVGAGQSEMSSLQRVLQDAIEGTKATVSYFGESIDITTSGVEVPFAKAVLLMTCAFSGSIWSIE